MAENNDIVEVRLEQLRRNQLVPNQSKVIR